MRTFVALAIMALVSAVDLTKGTKPVRDEEIVGKNPGTWSPTPIGDDEDVDAPIGGDPSTWSPTEVDGKPEMKFNDGKKGPKSDDEADEESEEESEEASEEGSEGEESEDPDMDDVKEFLGACQWIANNMTDEKEIDDAKNIDDKVNKLWKQVKDHPDLEEEREARGDDAEREAKDVGRGCIELYEGEAEERKRKNEPRLSPGEFFAAAKTFADNISEDAMENRDSKEGFK